MSGILWQSPHFWSPQFLTESLHHFFGTTPFSEDFSLKNQAISRKKPGSGWYNSPSRSRSHVTGSRCGGEDTGSQTVLATAGPLRAGSTSSGLVFVVPTESAPGGENCTLGQNPSPGLTCLPLQTPVPEQGEKYRSTFMFFLHFSILPAGKKDLFPGYQKFDSDRNCLM